MCCITSPASAWRHARLTVVDATNVRPEDRRHFVRLAREKHAFAIAIVLDLPTEVCEQRNAQRPDRSFGGHCGARPCAGTAPLHPPSAPGRLPLPVPPEDRRRRKRRINRAHAPVGPTSATSRARSTSSATSTAASTNSKSCWPLGLPSAAFAWCRRQLISKSPTPKAAV